MMPFYERTEFYTVVVYLPFEDSVGLSAGTNLMDLGAPFTVSGGISSTLFGTAISRPAAYQAVANNVMALASGSTAERNNFFSSNAVGYYKLELFVRLQGTSAAVVEVEGDGGTIFHLQKDQVRGCLFATSALGADLVGGTRNHFAVVYSLNYVNSGFGMNTRLTFEYIAVNGIDPGCINLGSEDLGGTSPSLSIHPVSSTVDELRLTYLGTSDPGSTIPSESICEAHP